MSAILSNSEKPVEQISRVSVGVYGHTAAGKTRFLYELVRRWERERRLVAQSMECQQFLSLVDAQIAHHGDSRGTVAPIENIAVTVCRESNSREWVFRDLQGEVLSKQLDRIDDVKLQDAIPAQVDHCDGFLFFFDPSCSDAPERVEQHHRDEFRRAERFIEYVLDVRENRHLPIIFVLTHRDLWEKDQKISPMANDWAKRIHASLRTRFTARLGTHCPPELTDRSRVVAFVSSPTGTGVESVIDRLAELVAAARNFGANDRRRGRKFLVAGLFVMVLMLAGIGIIALSESGARQDAPLAKADRSTIASWGDDEVNDKLDDLDRLVKSHPLREELPPIEDAKKINGHLRWLVQKIELSRQENALPLQSMPRMTDSFNRVTTLIADKTAGREPWADRLAVLRAYLDDLPDMAGIGTESGKAQAKYWTLQRSAALERIGDILARRRAVVSTAPDTLAEVTGKLKELEQETSRDKVFGPDARKKLIAELQTAATFCEDRNKAKYCEVTFKLIRATCDNADATWRSLVFAPETALEVEIYLQPKNDGENQWTYSTKEPTYRLKVGLANRIVVRLNACESDKVTWKKLHDFPVPDEPGALAALGLPLARRQDKPLAQVLRWEGYQLEMEFSEFPAVPPLLWDAAELNGKGGRP